MKTRQTVWLRLICLLVVLVMTVATLAACGGSGDGNGTTGSSEDQTPGPEDSETTGGDDALAEPDLDFTREDGTPETFTMLVRTQRYHYLYCDDGSTNDTVQYATYSRNMEIEEDYGVEIKIIESAKDSAEAFLTKLNTASDGEIDLVCWDYWFGLAQQGLFVDLRTVDYIDPANDWYISGWNDNTTINGISYSLVGDAALDVLENIEVIFFNKQMATANNIDFYGLVDDGDWTVAKLGEIAKDVSNNLDDENSAIYGAIYDWHALQSGLFSVGLKIMTVSKENGSVAVTIGSQKNIDVTDAFSQMLRGEGVKYSATTARGTSIALFGSGRSLIQAACLYRGGDIRAKINGSFGYGVLVAPKYDSGSDYISTSYGVSVFSIPKSCADRTKSAVILDIMNRRSADTIVTAFYDKVLLAKVADSPEDAKMLDLARNSLYFDFAFASQSSSFNIIDQIDGAVLKGNSLSGLSESFSQYAKSQLDSLLSAYQ